jgi:hypothetical protein
MKTVQLDAALKALAWQNWHYSPDSDANLHRKSFYDGKIIAFANLFTYDENTSHFSIIYAYASYGLDDPDSLDIPNDMPAAEVFLAVMKILVEVENQVNQNDPT